MLAADKAEAEKPAVKRSGLVQFCLVGIDDAVLLDGRFKDKRVSELINSVEGRDYLGDIWNSSSEELRVVLRKVFA